MYQSRQQAGQHFIVGVSRIKTTQNANNGRQLFDQSSEKASYQAIPQYNYNQYIKRIHNLKPLLRPAMAGFCQSRINGLK